MRTARTTYAPSALIQSHRTCRPLYRPYKRTIAFAHGNRATFPKRVGRAVVCTAQKRDKDKQNGYERQEKDNSTALGKVLDPFLRKLGVVLVVVCVVVMAEPALGREKWDGGMYYLGDVSEQSIFGQQGDKKKMLDPFSRYLQASKKKKEMLVKEQSEKAAKERAAKEKAEREKEKERERAKREQERIAAERKAALERERREREKRRRFEQQALLGGSAVGIGWLAVAKWPTVAGVIASLFRTLGGPSLVSMFLRTPGYIVGRTIHLIEWDVAANPSGPNGKVFTIKLRKQTPAGLAEAIRNKYRLGKKGVMQMCHWMSYGPGFFEPLTTAGAFNLLPESCWVVWSRMPKRGKHAIPSRGDAHLKNEHNGDRKEVDFLLRFIHRVATLSRALPQPPEVENSHKTEEDAVNHKEDKNDSTESIGDDYVTDGSLDNDVHQFENGENEQVKKSVGNKFDRSNHRIGSKVVDQDKTEKHGGERIPSVESGSDTQREHKVGDKNGGAKKPFVLNLRPVVASISKLFSRKSEEGGWETDEFDVMDDPEKSESPKKSENASNAGGDFGGGVIFERQFWFDFGALSISDFPEGFKEINDKEEEKLILLVASSDERLMRLFRAFVGQKSDIWTFLRFARALTLDNVD